MQHINQNKKYTLTSLLDTLLPELMSGEVGWNINLKIFQLWQIVQH